MILPESNPAIPQFVVRHYATSQVPVYVDNSIPFFFVLLEGEISIECDSFPPVTIHKNQCVLIMRHSCYRMTVLKPSMGMRILHTEQFAENCQLAFGDLNSYLPRNFEYTFRALTATPAIVHFLHCAKQIIDDGHDTPRMHSLWIELLSDMIAAYYPGRQAAEFLYPLVAGDYDFRCLVIEHSLRVKDLPEMAAVCGMSLSTFKRRFKRTFQTPAHTWIATRKAHYIYNEIIHTRKTFVEIAEQFNISSSAYLTAFCKQHFGMTPQEIRRRGHESPASAAAKHGK